MTPTPLVRVESLVRHTDARGDLIKAWPAPVAGEVYAVELRPGHPRGHHWHQHGGEWFVPLRGACWLVAEHPVTGTRAVIHLVQERVYVPAGVAHALFCDADALVLAIAEVHHDAEVTVRFPVQGPTAAERVSPC